MTKTVSGLKPGNVYSYDPDGGERHCREGVAFVTEKRTIIDTFWGAGPLAPMTTHYLTDTERATMEFQFNVNDLRPAEPHEPLGYYEAGTVFVIPSQHGLQREVFVTPGTQPSAEVIVENAAHELRAQERAVQSATQRLDFARRELARMENGGAEELAKTFARTD